MALKEVKGDLQVLIARDWLVSLEKAVCKKQVGRIKEYILKEMQKLLFEEGAKMKIALRHYSAAQLVNLNWSMLRAGTAVLSHLLKNNQIIVCV